MIVAVAALRPSASDTPSFPPQQSPMLGQRASSQTVCRLSPRRSFLIFEKEEPFGMLVFRKDGNLGLYVACSAGRDRWTHYSDGGSRFGVPKHDAFWNPVCDEVVQGRPVLKCLAEIRLRRGRSSQTPHLRARDACRADNCRELRRREAHDH